MGNGKDNYMQSQDVQQEIALRNETVKIAHGALQARGTEFSIEEMLVDAGKIYEYLNIPKSKAMISVVGGKK